MAEAEVVKRLGEENVTDAQKNEIYRNIAQDDLATDSTYQLIEAVNQKVADADHSLILTVLNFARGQGTNGNISRNHLNDAAAAVIHERAARSKKSFADLAGTPADTRSVQPAETEEVIAATASFYGSEFTRKLWLPIRAQFLTRVLDTSNHLVLKSVLNSMGNEARKRSLKGDLLMNFIANKIDEIIPEVDGYDGPTGFDDVMAQWFGNRRDIAVRIIEELALPSILGLTNTENILRTAGYKIESLSKLFGNGRKVGSVAGQFRKAGYNINVSLVKGAPVIPGLASSDLNKLITYVRSEGGLQVYVHEQVLEEHKDHLPEYIATVLAHELLEESGVPHSDVEEAGFRWDAGTSARPVTATIETLKSALKALDSQLAEIQERISVKQVLNIDRRIVVGSFMSEHGKKLLSAVRLRFYNADAGKVLHRGQKMVAGDYMIPNVQDDEEIPVRRSFKNAIDLLDGDVKETVNDSVIILLDPMPDNELDKAHNLFDAIESGDNDDFSSGLVNNVDAWNALRVVYLSYRGQFEGPYFTGKSPRALRHEAEMALLRIVHWLSTGFVGADEKPRDFEETAIKILGSIFHDFHRNIKINDDGASLADFSDYQIADDLRALPSVTDGSYRLTRRVFNEKIIPYLFSQGGSAGERQEKSQGPVSSPSLLSDDVSHIYSGRSEFREIEAYYYAVVDTNRRRIYLSGGEWYNPLAMATILTAGARALTNGVKSTDYEMIREIEDRLIERFREVFPGEKIPKRLTDYWTETDEPRPPTFVKNPPST